MAVEISMNRREAAYALPSRRSHISARGVCNARLGASALALLLLIGVAPRPIRRRHPRPDQQPSSNSGNSELDVVTVEAQKQRKLIEEQISKFVSSITLPGRKESAGRWQPPICPLVAGLPRDKGEFILARLSQVARDSHAPLAPEACKPNFLIVATTEPKRLLEMWWARSPGLFNRVRGIGGAKHFVNTDRPVRIWYNANAGCGDGAVTTVDVDGFTFPSCTNGGQRSKLYWAEVTDIQSVIVVVDLGRINGLNVGQMADYIAMTGLAEIREDAEPGPATTILTAA